MSGIKLRLTAMAVLLVPSALSAEGLSLDECLDLAARGNLSLLQQQERLEIARVDVDVQAAAGWPREATRDGMQKMATRSRFMVVACRFFDGG